MIRNWGVILKNEEEFLGPMTEESASSLWDEDNPDDLYKRPDSIYPLQEWLLRKINGEVVGIQGFTQFETYAYVGGSKGRRGTKGNILAFEERRKEYLSDLPKVAGFKAGRGEQESWVAKLGQTGWTVNPLEFEGVPQEVINEFNSNYGENWGIKKMDCSDTWWGIIKGIEEYNFI
jgi:hypothetical protein